MQFCCLNLVILVISLKGIASWPSNNVENNSTLTEFVDERITLNGRYLTEIPQGNNTIKLLDVSYNHLTVLPKNVFQNKSYKDLITIDIHENRIDNVSAQAFRGLRRLENVDLSHNRITEMDPYTFEVNRRIEKLDLTSNKIRFTKSTVFLVSPSMQTLVLANNNIDQLYELTFVGLKHLTNLILDGNTLEKIKINTFKPLNEIQFLSLANTRVTHLTTPMFTQIPRVINVESTPLANKFDPPLSRIKKSQVMVLLTADDY